MKFGENLYQRSVPKWSAYNVKYNELKHLIKKRTSTSGVAVPVGIPAQGSHRWQSLEDDLFPIIRDEHSNVCLFLGSKRGEIDRRISHLTKQVNSAQKAAAAGNLNRPILQARKYQRLVQDAEGIGEELDLLSRFAGVQKTAFRKILKKYRKWTGSTSLQERLNVEVFSAGALQFDYVVYRNKLAALTRTINGLAGPMLSGHQRYGSLDRRQSTLNQSNAKDIAEAVDQGPLNFDVALDTVPYGEFSGSHYYWIHPDNLEEAESLLLRHMRALGDARVSNPLFATGQSYVAPAVSQTHIALFDNAQRYAQDSSSARPSNVALSARWSSHDDGYVTLSSMKPGTADVQVLSVKRKDLALAMQRSTDVASALNTFGSKCDTIRSWLSEHRDVKPLAESHVVRSRYTGNTNSSEVGTWATLDTAISFSPVDLPELGSSHPTSNSGEAFPHAILHVRWEFSRMPEVVRQFDTSHLAERIHDFSLESGSIYTICKDLERPKWCETLQTDIRKIPQALRRNRIRARELTNISTSSGPSSSEGVSDSVFSAGPVGQSSATSMEHSPQMSFSEASPTEVVKPTSQPNKGKQKRKKRARIIVPPTPEEATAPPRYWNEFDDGDSDVNPEDGYAIYVDPTEESFPGAETMANIFSSMYSSLSRGKQAVVSWLPISSKTKDDADGVRTPLLFDRSSRQNSTDADLDSSGSDTDEIMNKILRKPKSRGFRNVFGRKYRRRQQLSQRQKALEKTLLQFYTGLIAIAYVLLLMVALLENSGRKKRAFEIDAGVVTGVSAAELCALVSILLIHMRRQHLGPVHWGLVVVNVTVLVVVGAGELTLMFAGR